MNINQKYTKTNIIFKKNSYELKYHKIKNTNQKKNELKEILIQVD